MKRILLFALILGLGLPLFSQNPNKFNYQAVVRDAAGKVVPSKAVGLRFSVFKGGTSGSSVFQEVHAVSTNIFGLVAVQIGTGTVVSGDISTINWGSDTFALKVEIDLDGNNNYSQLSFADLVSVPYAMHAKSADNVDDADADSTNELQSLSMSGDTIMLSLNGGMALISDNSDTNELIQSVVFSNDSLIITDASNSYLANLSGLNQSAGIATLQTQRNADSIAFTIAIGTLAAKQKLDSAALATGVAANTASITALSSKHKADSALFAAEIVSIMTKQVADSSLLRGLISANSAALTGLNGRIVADSLRLNATNAEIAAGAYKDSSSTNEIQMLSMSNDTIYLSNGGFVVLPATAANNDNDSTNEIQMLSISNDTVHLSNGGFAVLPATAVNNDNDSTNEIQLLSMSNDTIYLSDGGFVVLPAAVANNDNDSTNEYIDSLYLSGNNLILSQANSANRDTTDLSMYETWAKSGTHLLYKSGRVGVGTGSPLFTLHVKDSLVGKAIFSRANSSSSNIGIEGIGNSSSSNNNPIYGVVGTAEGQGGTGTGAHYGMYGKATGAGTINDGIYGFSNGSNTNGTNRGLSGEAKSTLGKYNQGVFGIANGATTTSGGYNAGVVGAANGHSTTNYGALTLVDATGNENYGGAFFAYGNVSGSKKNYGMYGYAWGADTNYAAYAHAADDLSATNYGVYSQVAGLSGSLSGYFIGNVAISGNLSVTGSISKGSGTFKIDHPEDPENKYLVHSFVESPEMMNVYSGTETTDANGLVTVKMPDYFEANNKDFRYQLTPIGQFAQCIIKEEIAGNSFIIQTDKPNVKVSWQVTGVRNDPYAKQNRIVPEVDKADNEKGFYLHPKAYGKDESKAIFQPLNGPDSKNKIKEIKESVSSSEASDKEK